MSVTFAANKSGQASSPIALAGGWWLLTGTLTFSGNYASGGDALDLRNHFPAGKTIRSAIVISNSRGVDLEVDLTNQKLKLWQAGAAPAVAEYPAGAIDTDLTGSGVPVAILLKG